MCFNRYFDRCYFVILTETIVIIHSKLLGKMMQLLLFLLCIISSLACAKEKPNIVIIFTDDQGYADVGCFGAEGLETPNLDKMASEGMKFTDFYVAQAVCGASRAALLTGCYPNRIGMLGAPGPNSRHGINTDEKGNPTFATPKEVEKEAPMGGEKMNIRKRHRRRKRR